MIEYPQKYAYSWSYWRARERMPTARGSTLASAAASVAVALAAVLIVAAGLSMLEQRLNDHGPPATARRWFVIPIAHAATPAAPLLLRSHPMPLVLAPGDEVTLRLGFKNAGPDPWVRSRESAAIVARADASRPSVFMASTWIDPIYAAAQDEPEVAPGTIGYVTVRVKAPQQPGTVTDRFHLRSLSGTMYAESAFDVTIVTATAGTPTTALAADLSIFATPPSSTGTDGTDPNFIPFLKQYDVEPMMRVGIARFDLDEGTEGEEHRIRSTSAIRVTTASGADLATVPAGTTVGIDYHPSSGVFHIRQGTADWLSVRDPVRLTPTDPATLLELVSYTKRLHWEGNTADNLFRGTLEVRYVQETQRLWAINELPIEAYLRGLVESSDAAPLEFHKAQAIAARSFALYHIERGGKYKKGQFILTNSAKDQVYRGEKAAARRPNFTRAAETTRGVVMTFDGDVVVTPYYAQSDGRTRAWHEVWGGKPKAWLASVADPVCEGKRKIGHGVGMSQRCAMRLADGGASFQDILRTYYQGIELRKIFE